MNRAKKSIVQYSLPGQCPDILIKHDSRSVCLAGVSPSGCSSILVRLRLRREAADREHVLAVAVQPDVMAAAQPSDVQRLVIPVVMGIDRIVAAHLTALLFHPPRSERPLNGKMGGKRFAGALCGHA